MGTTAPAQMGESRERILHTAEHLFNERGYASVTLRDIADALGIRQASLYYHFPGGKEALFVEVCEKSLDRHRTGLEEAIRGASSEPRDQLRAAACFILSQSVPDMGRMAHSDMPEIAEEHAQRLMQMAFDSLLRPIAGIFQRAYDSGLSHSPETILLAGAFISVIASIHHLPAQFTRQPRSAMADTLIDVFLYGLTSR